MVDTGVAIQNWRERGAIPTEEEARSIGQLWLDDIEGDDLEDTNLAGFVETGEIDPDLIDWVEGMLESLPADAEQTDSQREQAGELGAWLAYLKAQA